jgi:hypothetical protein
VHYYKNREKCIEYAIKWKKNNKDRANKTNNKYYHRNKERILKELKLTRNKKKWLISYHLANQRCNNPKNPGYKYYGKRGIKFLMTPSDFKYLWDRDAAYLMKIPTIDRINNDGNYELSNCRFIEKSENTIKRNYERARISKK